MEIKTKIRYLIICFIVVLPYEIKIKTNYKISYFGFSFDRKSTYSIRIIKLARKLAKNVNINFQKWFLKYNFKNSKYIKNIEVWSLRTPGL